MQTLVHDKQDLDQFSSKHPVTTYPQLIINSLVH